MTLPDEYKGEQIVAVYRARNGRYYSTMKPTVEHYKQLEGRTGIGDIFLQAFPGVNATFWEKALDVTIKMNEGGDVDSGLQKLIDLNKK